MIPVSERLIISIYDYSGHWAQPYIKAGYPVILWDKKIEGDILSEKFFKKVMCYSEHIYGILSATPCTFFAASGARWWKRISDEDLSLAIMLAQMVLIMKDQCENLKFWVQENPRGRLDTLVPELAPFRKMKFDPCNYGDPYTKETWLWGEFNTNLQRNDVFPVYGSMIHSVPGGKNQQEIRSITPPGFANAFFKANQ
jgi:hypothetical protein